MKKIKTLLYMIFIEKIKNNDCNNEGIFYTSKYPLMSCGFNSYYHLTKDKFEKTIIVQYENNVYEELLNFYYKHNKKNPNIIDYECENFNKNTLEMDIFPEIYEKIIKSIKLKCNIICKLYETFTFDSIKLISKLTKSYKNVYICKPSSSKLYNSEKFIICFNFLKEGDSIVNVDIFNQIKNLNIKTLNITYINLNKILKDNSKIYITTV